MHCLNSALGCVEGACRCQCCLCDEAKRLQKAHICEQDGGFEAGLGDICPACEEERKKFPEDYSGH